MKNDHLKKKNANSQAYRVTAMLQWNKTLLLVPLSSDKSTKLSITTTNNMM